MSKLALVTAAMASACLSVPKSEPRGGWYSRPKSIAKDERERRKKAKKLAQKARKRNR